MTPGSYNPANVLLSLAAAIATAAEVELGRDLFVHQLPADVTLPASVLRVYGGPEPGELRPVPVLSVQCLTLAGPDGAGAGLAAAQRLYAALYTPGTGEPLHHWSVPAKRLNAATGDVEDDPDIAPGPGSGGDWDVRLVVLRQPPGVVGRDGSGRWEIAFNFDVRLSPPE